MCIIYYMFVCMSMYMYSSSVGGYDWDFCVCVQYSLAISNSSFAALGVLFAEQTYTVTEGDTVNITLKLTSSYEFNFTVTLQYMNGSAGGESICGRKVEPLIQGIIYMSRRNSLTSWLYSYLVFGHPYKETSAVMAFTKIFTSFVFFPPCFPPAD